MEIFARVPPAFLPTQMVDEVLPWRWYEPLEVYKPFNFMPQWADYFEGVYMEVRIAPTMILQIAHEYGPATTMVQALQLSGNECWSGEFVSSIPLTYGALRRKIVQHLQLRRIASVGTEVKLFEMGTGLEKSPAPNKHVFKTSKSRASGSKVQKDALKKPWPRHRCGMQQYKV